MTPRRRAPSRWVIAACLVAAGAFAQNEIPVRRAQPVNEPPVAPAVPFDEPTPTATPRVRRALPVPAEPAPTPRATSKPAAAPTPAPTDPPRAPVVATPSNEPAVDTPEQRQFKYAVAIFGRKLYDVAAPEFEKFLGLYPASPSRAAAYFYLGECYRALNRTTPARSAFQNVLNEFNDSEFAGPAAYGIAEILFNAKEFGAALPLFHRAAAKIKSSSLALSARYFEARCLESADRKDEARDTYQQIIEVKDPNPYRDDSRLAVASIFLSRGHKGDALKQLETLSNETTTPALKAEATVRAGMVALELQQPEKGKVDKVMKEKAVTLLQKGRSLPAAGKWKGIAEVGLLRLQYQAGQYAELIANYKREQDQLPEEVRPEITLMVGNSERQLGHYKEAGDLYKEIVQKYPEREEAKDAGYQRLISLYNANDSTLQAEVDAFLKDNPAGERADQVKLLKAESLYKKQDYAGAAPVYLALRSSQLSSKLRAESAYKLGWCYVQAKDTQHVIEAFGYFLRAYPDNSQVPSALAQRALAYQQTKQYEPAVADLNKLLANYPGAREREAALQQKALILGQQDNPKGMIEAFQQLLKEYPKTAVAAQANYYIGKAAFDSKNYPLAISALDVARKLNKEEYNTLATLRIISSYFYLEQREPLAAEVNALLASSPDARVPVEVLNWLGIKFYDDKNYEAASKYLTALSKSDNLAGLKGDFWFYLGDSQLKLKNFTEAEGPFEKYLQTADDPAAKTKALLALGDAKIGAHKPDDAQKIAEQIMTLQPEGRVNGEARLLTGDVLVERERYEDAAKAYLSVALLYDDPAITPRALQKASKAYAKAGKADESARVARDLKQKYPDFAGKE